MRVKSYLAVDRDGAAAFEHVFLRARLLLVGRSGSGSVAAVP